MVKIAQYADHTTLFVSDIASIHTCISVLRTFEAASGAKVNLDKTEGLGLGSFQGRNDHPDGISFKSHFVKGTHTVYFSSSL